MCEAWWRAVDIQTGRGVPASYLGSEARAATAESECACSVERRRGTRNAPPKNGEERINDWDCL